jgi:pyridinium-3,5-biscarboxylic acid mononucleotide sulfurtransferase
MSINDILKEKQNKLIKILKSYESIAVAFSGGVDSSLLLCIASEVLGTEKVLAVTADSIVFPPREYNEAADLCRKIGVRQITFKINQLDIEGFSDNPENRCYICKKSLMGQIRQIATANGIIAVSEGSNADDTGDYRPGMQAVRELGIISPLQEADLTKDEIRRLLRERGIPNWNKQSYACLATRFVYGESIDEKRLNMVDQAEQTLIDMGFHQLRVRIHGDGYHPMARIEITLEEMDKMLDKNIRQTITEKFKEIGFSYITLDLCGYKTGSMNLKL